VLREGNVLVLANTSLEVAEACSGIRSLVSLITLALVYGYFTDRRLWVRLAIVASAVPVAIVANGARVAGTGIAAHYIGPDAAQGFFHEFSGGSSSSWRFSCCSRFSGSSSGWRQRGPRPARHRPWCRAPRAPGRRTRRSRARRDDDEGEIFLAAFSRGRSWSSAACSWLGSAVARADRFELPPARPALADFPMAVGGWPASCSRPSPQRARGARLE